MITITQSIFETHVPAFRDVESRTFEAILPTIQRVLESTYEYLIIPEDEGLSEVISAYVSLKAAYGKKRYYKQLRGNGNGKET
jgi:hypothetical protein